MYDSYDDTYAELAAEAAAERRRAARMHHWCDVCHGKTGPGSPCAIEEDEPEAEECDQ